MRKNLCIYCKSIFFDKSILLNFIVYDTSQDLKNIVAIFNDSLNVMVRVVEGHCVCHVISL